MLFLSISDRVAHQGPSCRAILPKGLHSPGLTSPRPRMHSRSHEFHAAPQHERSRSATGASTSSALTRGVRLPRGLSHPRRQEATNLKAPHLGHEGGAFALWASGEAPWQCMTRTASSFSTPACAMASRPPGSRWTRAASGRLAHALAELGVDVIEAGFPSASPDDFSAVAGIARDVRGATIAGLARCHARRHRSLRARVGTRRAPAHPRVHLHQPAAPLSTS
jgi:hypothetical protein